MRVDEAKMLSVDSLGMNVEAKRDGQSFKVRLPYPQPAEDRKGVKDQIVAMSRAAAASSRAESCWTLAIADLLLVFQAFSDWMGYIHAAARLL